MPVLPRLIRIGPSLIPDDLSLSWLSSLTNGTLLIWLGTLSFRSINTGISFLSGLLATGRNLLAHITCLHTFSEIWKGGSDTGWHSRKRFQHTPTQSCTWEPRDFLRETYYQGMNTLYKGYT
ncbi:hypothetical protein V6N13_053604 [Hibiscus sabdariffa]|uniref:Uncharacterized protein n=1 Tax=Hibiscus sabdariffa TaxID=183260 RepID=A0ABR2T7N7_9ROSI